jgi:N-acetylmuramoyl-L-alanine amidase-like protein/putative peptidoglycan binding protein
MLTLPPLKWTASPNCSGRGGQKVDLVVVHDCEGSYAGSIAWFAQRASQVSAHYVLRDDGAEATQMVELENKAWHACNYNPRSIGVEMAGFTKKGFGAPEWQAAANIVAFLLKSHGLPARWAEKGIGAGFCSHYDLGAEGGGHRDPTTDAAVWRNFVLLVQAAYNQDMPDSWGAGDTRLPPDMPPGYVPTNDPRHDEPEGSLAWIQMRLNATLGVRLKVDGLMGPRTRMAITTFQETHHLFVDGVAGPKTIAALAA